MSWIPEQKEFDRQNSQLILGRRPRPIMQRKAKIPMSLINWPSEKSLWLQTVTSFENKKAAHWPGRDQRYQEHLDILLCLLSKALLEEAIMKCVQKLSFSVSMKKKKIPSWFCCMISRCTEANDLNSLKMVQKKLPAWSFFKVTGDLNLFHI